MFPKTDIALYNHVTSKLSELDMEIIRAIPSGGNWKDIPLEIAQKSARIMQIRESGGRTTYYGRLRNDLPSYTISTFFNRPGNGTFIHPTQNRLISHREAARLQSFPDDFRFLGSHSSKYKQIGNAIPPLLSRAIGLQMKTGRSVDLFSGAGGLSHGLVDAGHEMIVAVDSNSNMCQTYSLNHPFTKSIQCDMSNPHDVQKAMDEIENTLSGRTLNLIAGGPPCQGFSTAGKWNIADSRNALVFSMFRMINHFLPKYVLIENVVGLRWMQQGAILRAIIEQLKSLDYYVEWYQLYAEEYGVPQRRQRIFIVANRDDDSVPYPVPMFRRILRGKYRDDIRTEDSELHFPVTVHDAISDLPVLKMGAGVDTIDYDANWTNSEYQRLMRGLISIQDFFASQGKKG